MASVAKSPVEDYSHQPQVLEKVELTEEDFTRCIREEARILTRPRV